MDTDPRIRRHLSEITPFILGSLAALAFNGCGSSAPAASKGTKHVEIADRRDGLQLWSNNLGSPANHTPLKLGQKVAVICLAPNYSGMHSADPGFYKFKLGNATYYGISNEFANGDPVGASGYYTTVDPKVPAC